MLDFLVSSRARRRLLELLWGKGDAGSATALAGRAGIGFASAWRELRGMQAHGLVVSSQERGVEVYRANVAHPLAHALRALVVGPAKPAVEDDERTRRTRAELRAIGAPLVEEATRNPKGDIEESIVRGVQLAHRDAAVARTLPVCLYRQRDALQPERLVHWARKLGEKRALGFFLDLTTTLSKDPRFVGWAAPLRDRRCVAERDFFPAASRSALARRAARRNTPAPARRWGLRMNMGLEAFASTFDRFGHAA